MAHDIEHIILANHEKGDTPVRGMTRWMVETQFKSIVVVLLNSVYQLLNYVINER